MPKSDIFHQSKGYGMARQALPEWVSITSLRLADLLGPPKVVEAMFRADLEFAYRAYIDCRFHIDAVPSLNQAKDLIEKLLKHTKSLRVALEIDKGQTEQALESVPSWLRHRALELGIAAARKRLSTRPDNRLWPGGFIEDEDQYGLYKSTDIAIWNTLGEVFSGISVLELVLEGVLDAGVEQISISRGKGRPENTAVEESLRIFLFRVLEQGFEIPIKDNVDSAGQPTGSIYQAMNIFYEVIDTEESWSPDQLRYYFRKILENSKK